MSVGESVLRFLGTGLLNTAFGYVVYALLIVAGAPVWIALGGATVLGIMFNFYSYGKLVFGPSGLERLPAFIAVYLALYGLNVALAHVLMATGMGALLAQALLLPFLTALAFILMRLVVFSGPSRSGWAGRHPGTDTDHAGPRRP